MNVPVPHQHHVLTLCAGADSLLMESSRRVVGAGKRKGLNPVKQVLVQPHEANNTSTETSTRLTDSPEKEAATKRSREAIASTPLDLSVSKAEFGGRRKQVRAHFYISTLSTLKPWTWDRKKWKKPNFSWCKHQRCLNPTKIDLKLEASFSCQAKNIGKFWWLEKSNKTLWICLLLFARIRFAILFI